MEVLRYRRGRQENCTRLLPSLTIKWLQRNTSLIRTIIDFVETLIDNVLADPNIGLEDKKTVHQDYIQVHVCFFASLGMWYLVIEILVYILSVTIEEERSGTGFSRWFQYASRQHFNFWRHLREGYCQISFASFLLPQERICGKD